MAIARSATEPTGSGVDAIIKYPERAAAGGRIWGNKDFNFELEDHRMRIRNARLEPTSFEAQGFTLLHRTLDVDFTDKQSVEQRWHPQAKRLIRDLTGAREVFAFLGILRGGETAEGGGPALMAHVDFNAHTLRHWVTTLGGERGPELAKSRLVNINLWTPVRPVQNSPLAVCDALSIQNDDILEIAFGRPETLRTDTFAGGFDSGGFVLAFNPGHRWYYYPDMQPDEVLAFRLCDTGGDSVHMTAHTAFDDPTSVPGSPKRMSYELRTIAVLD
ncbi:MAG TPA: CmcJ/NvfI family oxidoreductase [Steroidobacteraceae bacterium]|nr:CmcJ/NvfI family oxidoreductase [Steroidobacteraceae bacterium]